MMEVLQHNRITYSWCLHCPCEVCEGEGLKDYILMYQWLSIINVPTTSYPLPHWCRCEQLL